MKNIVRKAYYWLPPIIWAIVIFVASSQPYEQQDLRPTILENIDLEFVEQIAGDVSITYAGSEVSIETRGVAGFIEFFIRKGAHFFVYLVLGFLVYRLFHYINIRRYKFIFSLLIVVLYAISDEVHQYLTPNRTALVEDVILDSIGGLVGVLLAQFIFSRKVRRL
ncbi:VanZ family protein [Anaerobacillus sp. CMMVII]|uniref:VanZ family protein n=1 Tax=Anaerobacillus sp. CMMVII TaxID=2755588 RepID=UPI0021B75EE2|nr:VanZ family protein [Anaerobacillus sp. CMMVII]MCT8137686.1 VanZ family protein [Anaerobacillus sp. CMMVII]